MTTYFLTRANHRQTIEKERLQRQREMLELVSLEVATFHQLALRHWAYAFNWTERAWPTETKETANNKLEQLREELTDGFNQLSSAEPKLILLGDETGRKLLREYGENILCYKTDLILARAISLEKMESYKGDLEMRRTEFFGELSRVYKTL